MGANIQSPPAYSSPGTLPTHQRQGGHGHIAMYPQGSGMNAGYRMAVPPDKRKSVLETIRFYEVSGLAKYFAFEFMQIRFV